MAAIEDPYFTGMAPAKSPDGEHPGAVGKPPILHWSAVYLANLILPTFLGSLATRGAGKVGMALGIVMVFSLGWVACHTLRRAMATILIGGWIVAACQLFVLLHIFAGAVGIGVAEALTGKENLRGDDAKTVLGRLLATVITGAVLLAAAVFFGAVYRAFAASRRRARKVDVVDVFR